MFRVGYKVICDNEDFIIIEKFSGIEFHGEEGIVSLLRKEFSSIYGVHRLDRETSGLMVFAKTKEIQKSLSAAFEKKLVHKCYIALGKNRPSKKMGMIIGDLEKSRGGSYKLARTKNNPSKTQFFSGFVEDHALRLFCLKPFTGRTHQLRVALKSIGTPIIGDERYKGECSDRMYLHSYLLRFQLNGEDFEFCEYPSFGEHFKREAVRSLFETNLHPNNLTWK